MKTTTAPTTTRTEGNEMKTVHAHITIDGTPLCECEGHHYGLIDRLEVACGHVSLASAHRAKREIQKYRHFVRVVRGDCPVVVALEK